MMVIGLKATVTSAAAFFYILYRARAHEPALAESVGIDETSPVVVPEQY